MPSRHEARGEAVINKYERDYAKDEAKAEALEEKMKDGLAGALKKDAEKVVNEFKRSLREGKGDDDWRKIQDTVAKGTEMPEDNWSSEVTGYEERPWEKD